MGGTGDEHPLQLENGAPMTESSLPTKFDYSDVVFPDARRDFLRAPGMHSLYVAESLQFIKIGIASEPLARMRGMTCDNPHGIRLLVAYALPYAVVHWAEMYCHLKLMPFHHHGEWFKAPAAVGRKVAYSVCWRAAAARGIQLQKVSFAPGQGVIERKGPPTSLRLLEGLRDQIANPTEPRLFESRRAAERSRRRREAAKAGSDTQPDPEPLPLTQTSTARGA